MHSLSFNCGSCTSLLRVVDCRVLLCHSSDCGCFQADSLFSFVRCFLPMVPFHLMKWKTCRVYADVCCDVHGELVEHSFKTVLRTPVPFFASIWHVNKLALQQDHCPSKCSSLDADPGPPTKMPSSTNRVLRDWRSCEM